MSLLCYDQFNSVNSVLNCHGLKYQNVKESKIVYQIKYYEKLNSDHICNRDNQININLTTNNG